MNASSSSLLMSLCSICGEPIFRHRTIDGRQITCEQLARIDQQLRESGSQASCEPARAFVVVRGGRDRQRQGGLA
jgi:hypothetical protein